MINGKSVISIIPARGGSKGLPGKNIKHLSGKPLISWTIKQALSSKHIDTVVVSTDSQDIANISKSYGAQAPFIRPVNLATDVASTHSVVQHCLDYYLRSNSLFDYVVLLEPTSPLRRPDDIDTMLTNLDLNSNDFDSIVSLGETHAHPSILKIFTNGSVSSFLNSPSTSNLRRQDHDSVYFPYGVAYVVKTAVLLKEKTFYTQKCMGHLIERWQHYEIDDLCDFLCVEAMIKAFGDSL